MIVLRMIVGLLHFREINFDVLPRLPSAIPLIECRTVHPFQRFSVSARRLIEQAISYFGKFHRDSGLGAIVLATLS